jgi:hypothetical protein
MILRVLVDTGGAEDGYDEDDIPDLAQHKDDIGELLRSGYYEVKHVEAVE